jgi:hypothetical protein
MKVSRKEKITEVKEKDRVSKEERIMENHKKNVKYGIVTPQSKAHISLQLSKADVIIFMDGKMVQNADINIISNIYKVE